MNKFVCLSMRISIVQAKPAYFHNSIKGRLELKLFYADSLYNMIDISSRTKKTLYRSHHTPNKNSLCFNIHCFIRQKDILCFNIHWGFAPYIWSWLANSHAGTIYSKLNLLLTRWKWYCCLEYQIRKK